MNFEEIQSRLLARLHLRLRNGDFTERGFARFVGISQPHIHKVLKGARTLSPRAADIVLRALNISILDLYTDKELRTHVTRNSSEPAASIDLPVLAAALGPGLMFRNALVSPDCHPVPCSAVLHLESLVLVRLSPDPSMQFTRAGYNIALLRHADWGYDTDHDQIYAVDRAGDSVLRRVRRGAGRYYLATDENIDDPHSWESIADIAGKDSVIRGKIIWFGRERGRKPNGNPRYLGEDTASS